MKYCVNCRTPYQQISGACPTCYSDQTVPDELIEETLRATSRSPAKGGHPFFSYPGEHAALLLAILVSLGVAAVIGTLTFGLFLLLLGLNVLYLLLDHLRNPQTMIRISEHSFKPVFRLSRLAAYRLGIPLPTVYVEEGQEYNAYTKGFHRFGFIVVQSSLVRDFRPLELLFVLGHEMGHIKRNHTTWLNLTHPARVSGARFVFAPVMQVIFNVWSVKSEYTADQAGLIACRDLQAAVMTMLKLAGGAAVEKEVDLVRLLADHRGEPTLTSGLLEYLSTHPFSQNRIRQLIGYANSAKYRAATQGCENT